MDVTDERAWPSEARLNRVVDRFGELRTLVLGDLLLDEYRSGRVDRVSPEAPVPIVRVARTTTALGGAGNVARNLAALGAECALGGVVGEDAEGEALLSELARLPIAAEGVVRDPRRPTTHKLRIVARGQQMLRLDREDDAAIGPESAEALRDFVAARLSGCDVLVLVDYAKGVFAGLDVRSLIAQATASGRAVVADPKRSLARFRGASLVKPNLAEAERFAAHEGRDTAARRVLCEKLRDQLGGGEIVVTRGRAGMSGLDRAGRFFEAPTRALEVFDVQGAGDTALAVLALCRSAGASLAEACIVANAASAVAVEKVGTAVVEPDELRARLPEAIEAFARGGRGEQGDA